MNKHINTFKEGLDKDTNVNNYNNQNYTDAKNIRLIVDEANGSGVVTNLQGVDLTGYFTNETIVGVTTVNDKIIIFTKVDSTVGRIYYLTESQLGSHPHLIQKDFAFGDYVEIIARYQNTTTTKIWWVDGVNVIRSCNLEEDLSSKSLDYFDVYSNVNLPNINFINLIDGNLKAGSYQYAYALYSRNKVETVYSISNDLIPVSNFITGIRSKEFRGSPNGSVTNKGISINIVDALTKNPSYSNIRIVRLFYPSKNSVPEVNIVYEGNISNNITFNDVGNSLGTLVFEDIRKLPNIFVANTLETKFDYLFAGNVIEDNFDVDIDMRMYQYYKLERSTKYYKNIKTIQDLAPSQANITGRYTITPDNYKDVPKGLVNPYNLINLDESVQGYRYNSLELGGDGIYGYFTFGDPDDKSYSDSNYNSEEDFYDYMRNPIEDCEKRFPIKILIVDTDMLIPHPNIWVGEKDRLLPYKYTGHQRDEVYRYGIVFTDKKGRKSFVKHISDVRIPKRTIVKPMSPGEKEVYAINLGIRFVFNDLFKEFLANHPDIVGYQIVRCSRDNDGTVIDSGYLVPTYKYVERLNLDNPQNPYIEFHNESLYFKNEGYLGTTHDTVTTPYLDLTKSYYSGIEITGSEFFEFIHPSSNYNILTGNATRLDLVYKSEHNTVKRSNGDYDGKQDALITKIIPGKLEYKTPILNGFFDFMSQSETYNILESIDIQATEDPHLATSLPGGKSILPQIIQYAKAGLTDEARCALKGTTTVLKLNDSPLLEPDRSNESRQRRYQGMYCYLRNLNYPYGGYDEAALANSVYIPCTDVIPTSQTKIDVFGGDTFITFFEQLRGFSANIESFRNMNVVHALIESKLNFDFNTGKRFSYYDPLRVDLITGEAPFENMLYYNMKEFKGAYTVHNEGSDKIFSQLDDFYDYNTAYVPSSKTLFYPKPLDFVAEYDYSTRIYRSDKKFNSELSDSWSEFKFNNFIDLDNAYGELTKLILHNGQLMSLQPKALSLISVEPREIMPSSQGGSLSVATGGIMDRYDYITTYTGSNFQRSVLSTQNGLYFYDGLQRKIVKFGEGIEFISDTKGLLSDINNLSIIEFHTLYHPVYKEVWFNYKKSDENILRNYTYNEYLQSFISTNDIVGKFSINLNNNVYFLNKVDFLKLKNNGYDDATNIAILKLDAINRNTYNYNFTELGLPIAQTGNSYIETIINPNGVLTNRFDILEFTIDTLETNPIESIEFSNAYQESGVITMTSSNLIRRHRQWRFNQLRSTRGTNNYDPRMVDTYMKLRINFRSTDNLIKLYDLITTYTPIKSYK